MLSPDWRLRTPPCLWPARKSSRASSVALGNTLARMRLIRVSSPFGCIRTSCPRSLATRKASPRRPSTILFTKVAKSWRLFAWKVWEVSDFPVRDCTLLRVFLHGIRTGPLSFRKWELILISLWLSNKLFSTTWSYLTRLWWFGGIGGHYFFRVWFFKQTDPKQRSEFPIMKRLWIPIVDVTPWLSFCWSRCQTLCPELEASNGHVFRRNGGGRCLQDQRIYFYDSFPWMFSLYDTSESRHEVRTLLRYQCWNSSVWCSKHALLASVSAIAQGPC